MPWKVIEKHTPVIKRATSFTLDVHDLTELCDPHSYLTDSLINYGVTVFRRPAAAPYGWHHNDVAWFAPTLVVAAKDGSDDHFQASLGDALGGPYLIDDDSNPLPYGARVLLFPVNTNQRHWSLLAFFADDRQFVHYDSLGQANTAAARKLITKLKAKGYLMDAWYEEEPPEIVRQQDGYNCGAYVVQFARKLMEVGRKLTGPEIQAITSQTSDTLREDMLVALQPLVGFDIFQHIPPSIPKNEDDYWAPKITEISQAEIEEERKEAIAKLKQTLAAEEPINISNRVTCPDLAPSSISVVISSELPDIQDVVSATVTFVLNGQTITRKATPAKSGKTWTVGAKLQCPGVVAAVRVEVGPGPEFEQDALAHRWEENGAELLEINPGEHKQVEVVFKPKPIRRLHASVGILLPPEREQDEERERLDFPDDFKLELVFDDGVDKQPAKLAHGVAFDAVDGVEGIRVPYRYKTASLRFPASNEKQRLSAKQGADSKATTLVDENTERSKDELLHWKVPKGVWSPLTRGEWQLPKEHVPQGSERKAHVDIDDNPLPWDAKHPLEYLLEAEPKPFLMNGHEIEHVVVLMLENRGFDHFMGYLYEGADKPNYNYPPSPVGKHAGLREFEGLEGINPDFHFDYSYEGMRGTPPLRKKDKQRISSAATGGPLKLRRGARQSNMPQVANPHEDFVHIFQDMYYVNEATLDEDGEVFAKDFKKFEKPEARDAWVKPDGTYLVPQMVGWAQNYCDGIRHHRGENDFPGLSEFTFLTRDMVAEILEIYLPDQLPVMSGLARHYAVSDLWFCSVPSQTNTNRAFWVAGSAAGLVTNDYYKSGYGASVASDSMPEGDEDPMLHRRCLFTVLDEHEVTWKYYWSCHWPPKYLPNSQINGNYVKIMFPQLNQKKFKPNTPMIGQFFDDIKAGKLPTVTYLEPVYAGGFAWDSAKRTVGNEFHPVCDMFNAEFFIKQIYDALTANDELWSKTVLMITFDENGGTYDHFPPWEAVPTKREPKSGKMTQFGFQFDCYGVRVPTLLLSKYVIPGTVFRSPTDVPLDHTSVISTILKWQGIDRETWKLGDRVYNAPTWDEVLQGDGNDPKEDERRANATGMRLFDAARTKRVQGGKPLQFDQDLHLKYIGNIWGDAAPRPAYLGSPLRDGSGKTKAERLTNDRAYYERWYSKNPKTRMDLWMAGQSFDDWVDEQAEVALEKQNWYPGSGAPLKFKIRGGKNDLVTGAKVTIELAEGDLCNGHTLAVPAAPVYSTVYLYDGGDPSKWILWLVNDRVDGVPLHAGDRVLIFSERYLPENLAKLGLEFQAYDSYQRLYLDADSGYAKWRPAHWDVWELEAAP